MAGTTQVLCLPGVGFTEHNVHARYNNQLARKKHPEYETRIDSVWEAKMEEGCCLFDKSKFRFYRALVSEKSVELWLGPTTYKEYIGTNCAPYARKLLDVGMMDTSESEDGSGHAYLAHPLGVGSLVETIDSKFVFLKRSDKCAESPDLIDVPGGHPEPEKVAPAGMDQMAFVEGIKITQEIFSSVRREIQDEVNISHETLGPLLLLGISFNKDTCYRPSLEFYVRCSSTSEEVLEGYTQGTQSEKYESTEVVFISHQDLQKMHQMKSGEIYEKLTNSAKDALYLLSIFLSWKEHTE